MIEAARYSVTKGGLGLRTCSVLLPSVSLWPGRVRVIIDYWFGGNGLGLGWPTDGGPTRVQKRACGLLM